MAIVTGWTVRDDGSATVEVSGDGYTHPQVRLTPGTDTDVDLYAVLDKVARHQSTEATRPVRSARDKRRGG